MVDECLRVDVVQCLGNRQFGTEISIIQSTSGLHPLLPPGAPSWRLALAVNRMAHDPTPLRSPTVLSPRLRQAAGCLDLFALASPYAPLYPPFVLSHVWTASKRITTQTAKPVIRGDQLVLRRHDHDPQFQRPRTSPTTSSMCRSCGP